MGCFETRPSIRRRIAAGAVVGPPFFCRRRPPVLELDPPPPPNQIVCVTAETPAALGNQWDAIWAIGVLRTTSNMSDLGDAAYTLEIESWETYDG